MITNAAIGRDVTWEEDGLTFTEVVAQEYVVNNCKFSAGFVRGHPADTLYLRLEKDGVEPSLFLLRPDEVAALAYCLSGVLYSLHLEDVITKE